MIRNDLIITTIDLSVLNLFNYASEYFYEYSGTFEITYFFVKKHLFKGIDICYVVFFFLAKLKLYYD